jgi:hypothetical protein
LAEARRRLRPGLPLVVPGQRSHIVSIATLTIAARLKHFDVTMVRQRDG